jgi:glycosyltransferase involved in cell wall biosynthesis
LISVLHFLNTLARGGTEEHVLMLLRGLDRRQFRLHLVCTPEVAEKLRADVPADVELLPLRLRKPTQAASAVRLMHLMRSRRVGILHCHQFYSSIFAAPLGRLCRVPVILETPHVREQWRRGWKANYRIDRVVGRCVDYYLANCQANARYLMEEKGLPAEKVELIYHGDDLKRFHPDHRPPADLRESLGFGHDDPVLIVLGRLEPQKGHHVLLDALPMVRREFPAVRLVCVGDGSSRGALGNQAARLGLQDTVRFVGHQSNVADWLALGDVTVLPSFFEGLPLVPMESLAAGRPVVASAVDGTPEIVISGKTGLTVPAGDVAALGGAVCEMLRDPALRRDLARAGREWVLEHFTEERLVERTQALYLSTWKEKTGAR